jgi:hypothetical protein
VPENTTSSSEGRFEARGYLRYITARRPWWVRIGAGLMVPVPPNEQPDLRNWALGAADAMNAAAPSPDAEWPMERAAADAEVEADEQPREER